MRARHRLSALAVRRAIQGGAPPMLHDGGGLYLQVKAPGAGSWLLRYMRQHKARTMGLGPVDLVPLAEARERAGEARKQLLDGIDPIDARREARAKASGITFSACAEAYIDAHRKGWRNAKHVDQWRKTIATYCGPVFGSLPVGEVTTALVCRVLEPLWQGKTETATRLRGRIESVLDWAKVRGYREGENPARWRGHLDQLLPRRSAVAPVAHHAALPYVELPGFYQALAQQPGVGALALRVVILTACRTVEVLGASWAEIDVKARVWTIPPERMKGKREHRVPLTAEALAVIEETRHPRHGALIFETAPGRAPSSAVMVATLRRMDRADVTPHGFRSTFRTWAAEQTAFPRELAEAALAHVLKDKVEAAYQRGDALTRRRKLMEAWGRYVTTPAKPAQVLPFARP